MYPGIPGKTWNFKMFFKNALENTLKFFPPTSETPRNYCCIKDHLLSTHLIALSDDLVCHHLKSEGNCCHNLFHKYFVSTLQEKHIF